MPLLEPYELLLWSVKARAIYDKSTVFKIMRKKIPVGVMIEISNYI